MSINVEHQNLEEKIRHSIESPDDFWRDSAQEIDWFSPFDEVCHQQEDGQWSWFKGGTCNTCYNALDRHVERGQGDRVAVIYESPIRGAQAQKITYNALLARVKKVAGMLRDLGVKKGERVVIYMPMIPEAMMAMLACARIGAIHSVVFGGFASEELAKRIQHAKAKVVLSASCGFEPGKTIHYKQILDRALAEKDVVNIVQHCVVFQRPEVKATLIEGRDHDWQTCENAAQPFEKVQPVMATDPLYLLYTSGTTGSPKGVVRDNGGYMVALMWTMRHIYGLDEEDVFFCASDIGWVVGHSYIVYGPLLLGCTTVLFEGKPVGTPDAGTFWRVSERHGVASIFTAPTALRAIIREDPEGEWIRKFNLTSLRSFFLAGERSDPETLHWAEQQLHIPVLDHWWQTETGWAICAYCMSERTWPVKAGSAGKAMPGYALSVLDDQGNVLEPDQLGSICIKLPLSPGCFNTLWNAHDVYLEKYMMNFPGYYQTGDSGYIDHEGYVYVMSRTDDIINVSGHRLSTGRLEEVISEHSAIAESAVFGIEDAIKGQVPICLFVMKRGIVQEPKDVQKELSVMVRDRVGAIASLARVVDVQRLPKTRSGKILRATLAKMISEQPWTMPATVDDPKIFDEIKARYQQG